MQLYNTVEIADEVPNCVDVSTTCVCTYQYKQKAAYRLADRTNSHQHTHMQNSTKCSRTLVDMSYIVSHCLLLFQRFNVLLSENLNKKSRANVAGIFTYHRSIKSLIHHTGLQHVCESSSWSLRLIAVGLILTPPHAGKHVSPHIKGKLLPPGLHHLYPAHAPDTGKGADLLFAVSSVLVFY